MSKEQEYKEIFLAEAFENHEELNRLLTVLEKKPEDLKSVNAIFRITHTLKGNAAGMGFKSLAGFAHVMEDLFGEVRDGRLKMDDTIFASLFKAADVLAELIHAVSDGRKVRYRGMKTKLEVLIKSVRQGGATADAEETAASDSEDAVQEKNSPESDERAGHAPEAGENTLEKQENKATGHDGAMLEKEGDTKIAFSDLVQVPVRKLDNLLNLVSELVIERDRIIAANAGKVGSNEYTRLNRISSDLQYSVMDVRLVQVGFLFNKFHRVIRDTASIEGKKVALSLKGTETEIDRNILQIISDSLIHLIRNAVGHGIETPEERGQAGKPEAGNITLSAFGESDAVIINITDDGRGIDAKKVREKAIAKGLIPRNEAYQMSDTDIVTMIFEPGFSTVDSVTSVSGRGVGMDVVKKALEAIGGNISVSTSQGKGTTFSLRLPSSMVVKGTLLFELGPDTFAIPLSYTEAVLSLYKSDIHKVANGLVSTYLDNTISVAFLEDLFSLERHATVHENKVLHQCFDKLHPEKKLDIVVVSYNGQMMGLVVDKLIQQKEIVEKPLMKPMNGIKVISGVTITGKGHVCPVVNVPSIFNMVFTKSFGAKSPMSY